MAEQQQRNIVCLGGAAREPRNGIEDHPLDHIQFNVLLA
jgi:hypothetical protein